MSQINLILAQYNIDLFRLTINNLMLVLGLQNKYMFEVSQLKLLFS